MDKTPNLKTRGPAPQKLRNEFMSCKIRLQKLIN